MPHTRPLELLTDATGSVTFGWVDVGVFYARFSHGLSAELGVAYANRLQALVEKAPCIKYFGDGRALEHYDLLARSAFVRVVLAQRQKFEALDLLAWSGGVSVSARSIVGSLGQPAFATSDPNEFEARLFAMAPRARWKVEPRVERVSPRSTLRR